MGPSPHLRFLHAKQRPELHVSMGLTPHLCCFIAFKTATLAPYLHATMGPSPHLSFCACKTA